MRIIFGTGSFRLLHQKPSELGLPSDLDAHITIEKRQEYFHLFWIPFFGIGQTWFMKKNGDKNRYDVPEEIETHLKTAHPKHKTPWYTYFLAYTFLLAFVGFVFLLIAGSIKSRMRDNDYHESMNMYQREQINNALPYTYIALSDYYSYDVTLRVLSSNKTHLRCAVSNRQDAPGSSHDKYPNAFLPDSNGVSYVIDTVMVSKAELSDAYHSDFSNSRVKKKINVSKFIDLRMYNTYYLDMPIFEISNFEIRDSTFKVTLKNTHVESTIFGITEDNSSSNNIWMRPITSPKTLKVGDTINLQGKVWDEMASFEGGLDYKTQRLDHTNNLKFRVRDGAIEISYE